MSREVHNRRHPRNAGPQSHGAAPRRGRPRPHPRHRSHAQTHRGVQERAARVGVALALAVSVAACSAGVSRFDFPAFNLGNGNGQAPSGVAGYSGQSSPKVYSYRPGDTRYGEGSAGRLGNQTSVQKYSGQPGSQANIRNNEFEVSSIARDRVERQQVAPPRDHAARQKTQQTPQYGNRPTSARPSSPVSGNSIVVRQGDTLFNLSQRHNVSVADLRAANSLDNNGIRIGQQLVIPGRGTAGSPAPQRVAAAPGRLTPPAPRTSAPQANTQPAETAKSAARPAPKKAVRTARADPSSGATPQNDFRWPVRGRVLMKFGAKADGSHNDGVNLAVPRGTGVRAAEGGVVAYAGSELKAYGKLILVRHSNNWVSAYAHNDEILVKRGDKVRRGQVISKAGTTGSVSQPQLHFELRKGSSPVDPNKYISGS